MKKKIGFCFLVLLFISTNYVFSQGTTLSGKIENAADNKPIPSVHIINLNKLVGAISNEKGAFEIVAEANDTLYVSYLGFKTAKVRVTNDFIKFQNATIQLTELAFALEEVVVRPYQLTGYLDIDAKNIPLSAAARYAIPGLPQRGYEAGGRNVGSINKIMGALFNPADFLYNIFGKKPKQLRRLREMKEDNQIRDLLVQKFDRQTLEELLQLKRIDIDEILRNCNYSDNFITQANDLQILEAISSCYEEFKVLNR